MSDITNIKNTDQLAVNAAAKKITAREESKSESSTSTSAAVTTDSVSLTSAATELQSIQDMLDATPIVNSDRVSALRAAIEDGSYHVDAEALASSMIDFERNL
ncbi:MAG: flagellar biosynthesis anti-sigma factor FlgM [Gammaproteobacteria bacterium]|nr:MAG: flagellar biosynthesis anti-sigma factor FlgM [Gammaproteobacteria bacterium]